MTTHFRCLFSTRKANRPHRVDRQSAGTVIYSSNELYKLLKLLAKLGLYNHP